MSWGGWGRALASPQHIDPRASTGGSLRSNPGTHVFNQDFRSTGGDAPRKPPRGRGCGPSERWRRELRRELAEPGIVLEGLGLGVAVIATFGGAAVARITRRIELQRGLTDLVAGRVAAGRDAAACPPSTRKRTPAGSRLTLALPPAGPGLVLDLVLPLALALDPDLEPGQASAARRRWRFVQAICWAVVCGDCGTRPVPSPCPCPCP